MKNQLLVNRSLFSRSFRHLSIARAAGLLAVAGLGLGLLPRPAAAAPASTPLKVSFTSLKCLEETDEWGSDEPYAVFFAADISGIIPKAIVNRTSVFDDVDEDETRIQTVRIWGVNGAAAPILNPANVIMLAGVMENDNSSADAVRAAVQAALFANLTAYKAAGLSRAQMVSRLIDDMYGALRLGAMTGGINTDERIGKPKELAFSLAAIQQARDGIAQEKNLYFVGDGGHYRLRFVMNR